MLAFGCAQARSNLDGFPRSHPVLGGFEPDDSAASVYSISCSPHAFPTLLTLRNSLPRSIAARIRSSACQGKSYPSCSNGALSRYRLGPHSYFHSDESESTSPDHVLHVLEAFHLCSEQCAAYDPSARRHSACSLPWVQRYKEPASRRAGARRHDNGTTTCPDYREPCPRRAFPSFAVRPRLYACAE